MRCISSDNRFTYRGLARNRRAVRVSLAAVVPVVAALCGTAGAAPQGYVGSRGDWSGSINWSNGTTPGSGDDAQLVQTPTNAVNVSFDPSATATNLASLITDGSGTRAVTLTQSANLLSTVTEYVGVNGIGTLNLNGGVHS